MEPSFAFYEVHLRGEVFNTPVNERQVRTWLNLKEQTFNQSWGHFSNYVSFLMPKLKSSGTETLPKLKEFRQLQPPATKNSNFRTVDGRISGQRTQNFSLELRTGRHQCLTTQLHEAWASSSRTTTTDDAWYCVAYSSSSQPPKSGRHSCLD